MLMFWRQKEREEETDMGNEGFRLFGVDFGPKIGDERSKKNDGDVGCPSDRPIQSNAPKKKVIQWSREEHKRFLIGLKEKGRGNWKEIASKYVKTRTKSQVASHAQKYFLHLRGSSQNKHRRSVFDMPSKPAASSQASTSSSSSPFREEGSTLQGLPLPMKAHVASYMARELPQNMLGFQSFVQERFPPTVLYVPMAILPGPPLSYLRSSQREFAAAAVTNQHPNG